MPIYAYRCTACGHAQDVLQKLSDPVLTECPACKAATFAKQVTAAGFQLKGSGWYVTDFRDGNKPPAAAKGEATAKPAAETPAAAPAAGAAAAPATPAASTAPAPAAASPAPAVAAPPASGS